MGKSVKGEVTYRPARISYGENYLLIALLLLVMFVVWIKIPYGWWSTVITCGILLFIIALLVEAELKRIAKVYVITNGEVIKLEGIVRKKKVVIPYQDAPKVDVEGGILGAILKVGTVVVSDSKNKIRMENVKDPEVICKIIQNKINLTEKKKSDDVEVKILKKGDK